MNPAAPAALVVVTVATAALLAAALLFAATTLLLRWQNARKAARWARLEAAWTPLMAEVLAGDRAPAELAARVAPADRLRFADFLVRYARRLRGEELQLVVGLARPVLPPVARRLGAASPERRARAVQTLSALGAGAHDADVVGALDDPSPLVALVAARALAARRQPAHVAAILAHLDRFEQWSPRYLASMLAGMGPAAAPSLRVLLADRDRPAPTRAVAADALRLLKDLEAADAAAAALPGTDDREVRAACLRLLAALGQARHLRGVRPLLASGDAVVRAAATRVVAQLGDADDVAALRRAVDDPDPWAAMEAARGLRRLGGLAALDELARSGGPVALLAREARGGAA